MGLAHDEDRAAPPRGETEKERLDRNLVELLQELRVAQTGVQILFAFLLILPFSTRFDAVTPFQRDAYLATLVLATTATVFIIAPVAYHRINFRRRNKRHLVFSANWMALAGLLCLALAMCGALVLAVDYLFGAAVVVAVVVGAALQFLGLWFVFPWVRRRRSPIEEPADAGARASVPSAAPVETGHRPQDAGV